MLRACGRCHETRWTGFSFSHAPYLGQQGAPLYFDLDSLSEQVESLRHRRPSVIPRDQWERGQQCECGAPATLQRVEQTLWFHALPATGCALVVISPDDDRVELMRAPTGGAPEPLTEHDDRLQLGEELTTFEGWRTAWEDALEEGLGVAGTGGVRQVVMKAGSPALQRELTDATLAIRLHAAALGEWPERLHALRSELEEGEFEAHLLVERRRLETLVAVAAGECDAALTLLEWPDADVVVGAVGWPVTLSTALLRMIRFGRTLPEAARSLVQDIQDAHNDGLASLQRMAERRPGLELQVDEKGLVTPCRGDAYRGDARMPPFHLCQAPSPALGAPAFERLTRFLCDPLDEWSDATKVCRCGAVAHLERRLISGAWLRSHEAQRGLQPVVLERWGDGESGAASVLAVVCDAHERLLEREELPTPLRDDEALEMRLTADLEHWVVRARAFVHRLGAEGHVAIQLMGELAGTCFLEERLLARLHVEAGRPPLDKPIAWSICPRALLLFDGRCAQADIDRLMQATALAMEQPETVPFSLLRDVDLAVVPAGTFTDPAPVQGAT